jgi:hypothetical protein
MILKCTSNRQIIVRLGDRQRGGFLRIERLDRKFKEWHVSLQILRDKNLPIKGIKIKRHLI